MRTPGFLKKNGFTFVEVLIALLIASLLITVACLSLTTSLRAEARGHALLEERFLVQTRAAQDWAGGPAGP